VGKEQLEYPEGHYEARCTVRGKCVCRNLGDDVRTALAEQKRLASRLDTKVAAAASGDRIIGLLTPVDLSEKADDHNDDREKRAVKP